VGRKKFVFFMEEILEELQILDKREFMQKQHNVVLTL